MNNFRMNDYKEAMQHRLYAVRIHINGLINRFNNICNGYYTEEESAVQKECIKQSIEAIEKTMIENLDPRKRGVK